MQAALADQQAAPPGLLQRTRRGGRRRGCRRGRPARRRSSGPCRGPRRSTGSRSARRAGLAAARPSLAALACRSWSRTYSRSQRAAAAAPGCRRTSRSSWPRTHVHERRPRATTPPIGRPLAMPLAKVISVGHDAVRLEAPEVLAGAAPAGLHLVAHEQDAVLVEHLLERPEQAVGRDGEAADALDRLGDQAGDVAGGAGGEHVAQVARRTPRCTSSSRAAERAAQR